MATDPTQPTQDETEVPAPQVTDDQVAPPASAETDGQDTLPEQITPEPGGPNVEVPSAAGPAGPPTDVGNAGGLAAVTADEADDASPTGGANVAGTPQSQLSQAPPMEDQSGSNIPAPNLVQPPAGELDADKSGATSDSIDPALADPVETAKAAHEGQSTDAAARVAGDVEGQGDVEIATIPATSGADEYWPALTLEDTVVLGEHELVAERLVGRRAFIIDAPRYLVPIGSEDRVWITVRTRDEVNATLRIPLSAVTIERGGKSPTVRG